MSEIDWIKNCTAKISNAIGGGSELFLRHGEEYRLDVDFVCKRISEMRERQHDAMHRAIKAERALAAKDAEIERLKDALRPFADVADFMDSETEGFSMTDCLQLVVQNEGFPTVHVNSFCLQRFYTARALIGGSDASA